MRQCAAQALILVDLQSAFVQGENALPSSEALLSAARSQLRAARAADALVVHLQNDGRAGDSDEPGSPGWDLVLDVDPVEVVLRKSSDDGFDGTGLDRLLRDHGITAISLCGLLSEMCVAATARTAMHLGYRVVLAHDSHATYEVPAYGPNDSSVPAELAARAAEWSLGDEVQIPERGEHIRFGPAGS